MLIVFFVIKVFFFSGLSGVGCFKMIELDILQRPVLLDGGMGRELRFRGVETPGTLWSALALTTAPEVVRQIHVDYIHAGADIITVNSYGIIRGALAMEKMEDQYTR